MELYKKIIGYEDYIIFRTGKIYSIKSKRFLKGFINTNHGYKSKKIKLCKNGKEKNFTVARLLMQHFSLNWDPNLTVDHINQNSLDNRLSNLRMADYFLQNNNRREIQCNNKSKYKNISYHNFSKMWIYQKMKNKKTFAKYFKTKEEAIEFKKNYESP